MTREQSYNLALERQRQALAYKKAAYEKAIEDLNTQSPEFARVNATLSSLGARLAITALSGDSKALSALQEQMTDLAKKRADILKAEGVSEIAYDCKACLDTGYINGKICDCIHKAAKELMLNDMSSTLPLNDCRFENFDLNFYQSTDDGTGNPRKRMTQILKLCREYTIDFDPRAADSLLFMGNTGLGKTHLTLAIVYELINRGFNVIYGASYNLFSEMETEHFSNHTNTAYNAAINCDLLVIDDLGGEFVSPYIQTLLYNVINTRDLSGKPTIINTNLSMGEIAERYTPRVASRLTQYVAKKFIGNDIRQLKAIEKQSV